MHQLRPLPSHFREQAVGILIVDDHRDTCETLRELLEAGGHEDVRTAYSGRDALTAVRCQSPDLIVSDLAMPGMSDPRFERSVIAMCVHDENGAFGVGLGQVREGVRFRELYHKPIVYDECKYEGNITNQWGRLTAREMVQRFWLGTMSGCLHCGQFTTDPAFRRAIPSSLSQ